MASSSPLNQKKPSTTIKKHRPKIGDFERIAQKMYSQNLALAQTNRTLSILRAIDLLVLEASRNLPQLSSEISNAIVEATPYAMIAVLSLNNYNERFLTLQGYSFSSLMQDYDGVANSAHMFTGLRMSLDGTWLSSKTRNLILSMDVTDSMKRVETLGLGSGIQALLDVMHTHFGLHSFYFSKFRVRESPSGVLLVGLEESMPRIDDIELIEQLVETTGIALESRLLFEENQRFLKELQIANDHLKELDASKDEFISMVSHQLRTPLTSIKGFMSMVLDGDTGQITDGQRRMLQQAFDSSQRMVYLIADLLNASRLRSGKLIIMRRPTNLPNVVTSELLQLEKAAELRKVKFSYAKPDVFPTVLLDETKIRQVVMNFLDNALYYTPPGGRVQIELKATKTTIEYSVTDTGMGVPESEQPQLFTKFYRAGNARKMRPEGTGIGIYMAKKIIVAEGGSIIFKSKEGKGSTFGFVFPREKIELKPGQEKESSEQLNES
jgi:signal transduction histidine kinase